MDGLLRYCDSSLSEIHGPKLRTVKKLPVQQTLIKAKRHAKKGEVKDAQKLYCKILDAFPENQRAQQGLTALTNSHQANITQNPPQDTVENLIDLYEKGHLAAVVDQAQKLAEKYAGAFIIWNILGAANNGLGRFFEASKAFQKVTELNPNYPDGFNNLGIALNQQEKLDEAIEAYSKAISLKPDYAEAYSNMGNALKGQGMLDETMEAYNKAIVLKPDYAKAYNNMGNALKDQGKLGQAIDAFRKAISLKPDYAKAYSNMGNALKDQGKLGRAIDAFSKAISLKPDYAEAYNNMGNTLKDQGKLDQAIEAVTKAISLKSDYAEAYNNMGAALQEQGKLDEAIEAFSKAIALKPDYTEAYSNMGNALKDQGKLSEAIEVFSTAIALKPDFAEAYNNMGNALKDQGKLDEAIQAYNKAISLKPDYAEAYSNMGIATLMKQDFTKGFELYEWLLKTKKFLGTKSNPSKPIWAGQRKKNVFLWAQQGIGDEIMFASLIPELSAVCSRLIVQCDERLIPLFKRSFCQDIIYLSDRCSVQEADYDFHIPMTSLPRVFRPSLESFNASSKGYLHCLNDKAHELRKVILGSDMKKLIGISWASASTLPSAHHRNIKLAQLAHHLDGPDTQLISLQYGDVSEEILQLKADSGIQVTEVEQVDNRNDIDGLAALIMACDQVISIDNATVHLAGALGADTKVLLPFNRDWRWGIEQPSSYWYNSLTLYRQHRPNDWDKVFAQVREDLRA
jgi:tetratricopeptide (TPR) repeat protein